MTDHVAIAKETADAAITAAEKGDHEDAAYCLASSFFAAAQAAKSYPTQYEDDHETEAWDNALNAAVLIASGDLDR